MTSTIDADLLVYGADETSPLHARAKAFIEARLAGPDLVYLFWPVAMAYLRISTHPRIFARPQALDDALANLADVIDRANVRVVGEGGRFLSELRSVVQDARPAGDLISDAHLVALMRENGVRTIWTRDRGFRRFSGIEVRDPFA